MPDDAIAIMRPRRTLWGLLVLVFGVAGVISYGVSVVSIVGLVLAVVVTAWLTQHVDRRRGVWATPDDLLIGNVDRMVRVPQQGASVVIEDVPDAVNLPNPELDDSGRRGTRTLFVVPGHPEDPRVPVEAAHGLTPKKVRTLAAAIGVAIEDRPDPWQ